MDKINVNKLTPARILAIGGLASSALAAVGAALMNPGVLAAAGVAMFAANVIALVAPSQSANRGRKKGGAS